MRDYVLVVEDDFDLGEVVQHMLEHNGISATIASNGQEALDAVAANMPSVILLDMLMPVMDGWEFAREFAARHGHAAPIIVVSAAENALGRADEIGAAGAMTKPFEGRKLIETIRRVGSIRREPDVAPKVAPKIDD